METFLKLQIKSIILAIGNDKQFASLCTILPLPGFAEDIRFKTNNGKVTNRNFLNSILKKKIKRWQRSQLLLALEKLQVPAGSVNNVKEVFESKGPGNYYCNIQKGLV